MATAFVVPDMLTQEPVPEALRRVSDTLSEKKWCYVSDMDMRECLEFFGATDAHLDALSDMYTSPEKSRDPVHEKYINFARHLFEKRSDNQDAESTWETRKVCPHMSMDIDDVCFKKANSGLPFRPYAKLPDWILNNTAAHAIMKFGLHFAKPSTQKGRTEGVNYNPDLADDEQNPKASQYIVDIFAQQVEKLPGDCKTNATASPEGIHQDGCDISFIMMHNLENIDTEHPHDESHGGVSRFYEPHNGAGTHPQSSGDIRGFHPDIHNTPCGDMDQYLLNKPTRLTKKFQAFIFQDQEVMHEARGAIRPLDPEKPARRNIMNMIIRRPNADGSDDFCLDMAKKLDNPAEEFSSTFQPYTTLFNLDVEFFAAWRQLKLLTKGSSDGAMLKKVTDYEESSIREICSWRKDPLDKHKMEKYMHQIEALKDLAN